MNVTSHIDVNQVVMSVYPEALAFFQGAGLGTQFSHVVSTPICAEKASQFFELCFANHADLPDSVKQAGIDVGVFATDMGFYGLWTDNRGYGMLEAMRGAGDGPEPLGQYSPAIPDAAPPVPEGD